MAGPCVRPPPASASCGAVLASQAVRQSAAMSDPAAPGSARIVGPLRVIGDGAARPGAGVPRQSREGSSEDPTSAGGALRTGAGTARRGRIRGASCSPGQTAPIASGAARMTLREVTEVALVLGASLLLARDMRRAWSDQLRRPVTLLVAASVAALVWGAAGSRPYPSP